MNILITVSEHKRSMPN
jgi:secreted trypsin-like serine protease